LAEAAAGDSLDRALIIPWKPMSPYRRREIIHGDGEHVFAYRPMETKARLVLVDALRDAQRWLDELVTNPTQTLETIAAREGKTKRSIRMTVSLAFLSPALVKAAIDGRAAQAMGRSVRRV
jgi:site-specific DNA recombinase